MDTLAKRLLDGSRRALARALTLIENDTENSQTILRELFPHTGNAQIIGMTGAPGTGKSSLVNALAQAYRQRGKTVAIIAVDPTSPFSGGAILGDRIRMRDLAGDKGIFIRSMATRGSLGGLSRKTRDAIRVLDAAGFDVILVETVGAGQSEVDIVRTAQTTLVIEAPGLGDDVQAIKAGILEIADILVVNKADRDGAQATERALKAMLDLGHPVDRTQILDHHGQMMALERSPEPIDNASEMWLTPVVRTVATSAQGIDELLETINSHQAHIRDETRFDQLEGQRIQIELLERLQGDIISRIMANLPTDMLSELTQRIQSRELDPQQAVELIIQSQELAQS